jgi:hypothetical protein
MRIAGEDEAIDAERHVLLHAVGDLVGVADQRGASPTPAHRFGDTIKLSLLPRFNSVMRFCPTESMRAKVFRAVAIVSASTFAMSASAACHASSEVSRTMRCSRTP